MNGKDAAKAAITGLTQAGADRAAASAQISEVKELNIEGGNLTLLRSTFDTNIGLKALMGDRKGTATINKLDKGSIDEAVAQTIELAGSSEPDPANEIAEHQPAAEFSCGIDEPDLDLMYERLDEFLQHIRIEFPDTILEKSILKFVASESWYLNSNDVDYRTKQGHYEFMTMFSTKKGEKSSSFNYSGFSTDSLAAPLWKSGSLETLISQSAEQLDTKPVPEKFVGDIIVTPDSLMSIIGFLTQSISDFPLITGTSAYKDKLGSPVASDKLTVHSSPLSDEIVEKYYVTPDGYLAENSTIVEEGILKTFLLSLYGARKTGGDRAVNAGGCYIVEPGSTGFEEMIASIEQGILVCRISGGRPGNNGDFSGVAKNSYYIREGKIAWPLAETMISANAVTLLGNITAVSRERVNFGDDILPWIQFSGVTASGK